MTMITKIKRGEYLYKRGDLVKRIRRNAYTGLWGIWSPEFTGAPAFALGFVSRSDAVRWLDETWGDEEVNA